MPLCYADCCRRQLCGLIRKVTSLSPHRLFSPRDSQAALNEKRGKWGFLFFIASAWFGGSAAGGVGNVSAFRWFRFREYNQYGAALARRQRRYPGCGRLANVGGAVRSTALRKQDWKTAERKGFHSHSYKLSAQRAVRASQGDDSFFFSLSLSSGGAERNAVAFKTKKR